MKIEVTQEHIDKGKKKDCDHCPIALALREVLKYRMIRVGYRNIIMHTGSDIQAKHYQTEKKVRNWIEAYDRHDYVEPFTFEIKL